MKHIYLVVGFDKEIFACYDNPVACARHVREWNVGEGGVFYRSVKIPVWDEPTYRDYQIPHNSHDNS